MNRLVPHLIKKTGQTQRPRIIVLKYAIALTSILLLCFSLLTLQVNAQPAQKSSSNTVNPMQKASQWVKEANDLAGVENYAKAIPLYEKAVALLPGETQLKKNLAVLYANYGLSLQRDKRLEEADHQFDKSLKLIPAQPEVIDAKAANLYLKAMAIREVQPVDYAKMHQLLDEAILVNPKEQAFVRNKAGLYQEEARDRVAENNLAAAAACLEKAQAIEPQNTVLKTSRTNLYLKLAQDHLRANPDQKELAQGWFEKARGVSASTETKAETEEKIKQILSNPTGGPVSSSGQNQHGFLKPGFLKGAVETTEATGVSQAPTNNTPTSADVANLPASAKNLTVVQMLSDIEKELGQPPESAKKPLKERLEALETQMYGAPKEGTVNLRVKALYASVLGERAPADHGSQPDLVQEPVQTSDHSYLDAIFKTTEGRVIRWNKFPIRVFIADGKENNRFKMAYAQAVIDALEAWKQSTGGFVSSVLVKNEQAADVIVTWTDTYTDRFASMEEVPDYYKKYAVPKANPMMRVLQVASMLAPGYFSLAPQAVGAALQYQQVKKLQVLVDESKIQMGLSVTDGLSEEAAKQLVFNMAMHEIGHVVGLKGHSAQEGDVMFPKLGTTSLSKPSGRDMETLRQLYSRPANLVLNIR
jgi:tetratricopeptide (TPR) repeat protein/predicted Zn-dependent protease